MIALAVIIVAVGTLLLYISSMETTWRVHPVIQRVVEHAGALIFVTGLLHLLWELYGKRVFLDEVLAKAGVAQAARSVGIREAYDDFQRLSDWPQLFSGVKELDILVSYARTWRNIHLQELRTLVTTPGTRVRLILPDPDDEAAVGALAERYATLPDEVRKRIAEAANEFANLGNLDVTQVWYMRGAPMYSWYRFDDQAVMSFYNHQVDRSPVPAFVVEQGGILFTFARSDFEKLLASDRVRRFTV